MRSFIKSHRKSNSLEGHEEPRILKHNNSSTSQLSPPRYSFESSSREVIGSPKTPTHAHSGSYSQEQTKHSPGFESLQRLFNTKLFKKSSNSSLNSYLNNNNHNTNNNNNNYNNNATSSTNHDPLSRRSSKDQLLTDFIPPSSIHVLKKSSSNPDGLNAHAPVIKGVITHSWGSNPKNADSQHVIVLNDPKTSGETTRSSASDLDPPPRLINKTNRTSVSSEVSSSTKESSLSVPKTFTNPIIQENIVDDSVPFSKTKVLSKKKLENRQARIHSNDDIMNLRKNSADVLLKDPDLYKFTDSTLNESTPTFLLSGSPPTDLNFDTVNSNEIAQLRNRNSKYGNLQSNRTSIVSTAQSEESRWSNHIMFDTQNHNKTPSRKGSNEDLDDGDNEDEDEDEDEEDEDDTSQFSFEFSNLSGRTPSVKYYSKPEEKPMVYIDDLYEDEDFDEDMNYYDENEISEIMGHGTDNDEDDGRFPSNNLRLSDFEEENGKEPVIHQSEQIDTVTKREEKKAIKKYDDLFALSDEDEDEFDDMFADDNDVNGEDPSFDNINDGNQNEDDLIDDNLNADGLNDDDSNGKNSNGSIINQDFEENLDYQNNLGARAEGSVQNLRTAPDSKNDFQKTPEQKHSFEIETMNSMDCPEQNSKGSIKKKKPSAKKAVSSFSDIFNIDSDLEGDEDSEDNGFDDNLLDETSEASDLTKIIMANANVQNTDAINSNNHLQVPTITRTLISNDSTLDTPQKTPVQILVTPEPDSSNKFRTPTNLKDNTHMLHPLPPPARSQALKFHDLNSELDSELPQLMSNLYFIDETEEDMYNELNEVTRDEDDYIDEINTVPEDFNFSDSENDSQNLRNSLRRSNKGSFRSTYSFTDKPLGVSKESTPMKNKLEVNNKTVTFFNSPGWSRSPLMDSSIQRIRSPVKLGGPFRSSSLNSQHSGKLGVSVADEGKGNSPVESVESITPPNSYSAPTPEYLLNYSLSPIQEASSVTNSPKH